ncbi:MAG TPA: ATP-binding protein [Candidatus Deferrimicrobiaceae bacterium]|jgi:PAS domain S-box-containing protein
MRLPLRAVIVLLLVLFAVLPAALIGAISYDGSREAVRAMSQSLRGEIVSRVAQHLDHFLESAARVNQANVESARQGLLPLEDREAMARYFWRQGTLVDGIGTVAFSNASGEFFGGNRAERYLVFADRRTTHGAYRRYATDEGGRRTSRVLSDLPFYDARSRNWYLTALNATGPTWAPISVSTTEGRLDLTAVSPWYGTDNALRGVFLAKVSLAQIDDFLRRLPVGRSGRVFIMERNGEIVASSAGEKAPGAAVGRREAPDRVRAIDSRIPMIAGAARRLAGMPGGMTKLSAPREDVFEIDGRRCFLESVPFRSHPGIDWIICTILPESDFMGPIVANGRKSALLAALALFASALAGWATARWVTRPIVALHESARALANGTWDHPVPIDRNDEVGALARTFNVMAERLHHSIEVLNREVVDRLRAEHGLRESEEKYRALFEESHDMIFISTPGGMLLDINPAGVRMLGFPSKEKMLGIPITPDLYASAEDRDWLAAELRARGEVNDFQTVMRRPDGREINVAITASAIRNGLGEFVALRGIVRDVTEHIQLEQQLRQAQKMEAVGQLAGGIAHDFNNILTAIIGYANLLEGRLAPEDPLAEYPRSIAASARKASDLTRGLLAFSRKQVLNMRPVDLNGLLEGMTSLLRRLVREDIEILTDFCAEPTPVLADPVQVEQVLMNLVTNAADAMPAGGKITLETRGREGHVILSVADTGTGMDEATQDKIFDPFFTTKEVGKGTGLGLAMVYGIVRQHKGTIYVDSEPGRGTCIKISLPASGPALPGMDVVSISTGPMTGRETILVAEDDAALRGLVREMLQQFGYSVLLAADGLEAFEIYRADPGRIDMLLVDLVMPRMNGQTFYKAAQELNPGVRALFYSGYSADLVASESGLDPGMHLLHKPFTINDLGRKVRDVLDGAPSPGVV